MSTYWKSSKYMTNDCASSYFFIYPMQWQCPGILKVWFGSGQEVYRRQITDTYAKKYFIQQMCCWAVMITKESHVVCNVCIPYCSWSTTQTNEALGFCFAQSKYLFEPANWEAHNDGVCFWRSVFVDGRTVRYQIIIHFVDMKLLLSCQLPKTEWVTSLLFKIVKINGRRMFPHAHQAPSASLLIHNLI